MLNNASFTKSGHYTNIFDSINSALISDTNNKSSFNAPISSIKGAATQDITQNEKPSLPFIDNVPKFFLDADTNQDGYLGKNELDATKIGNKYYTSINITLPPATKTGNIIKIQSGLQSLKYKIDLDNNELIQVDDSGTLVAGSAPQPLIDGKAKTPSVE